MRFGVLGPVIVDSVDEGRVAIPQPKRRAVLALLAANAGHPISVARLVDGVWGAHPPPTAAKNIHVHVCQLRKLTGARLRSDNGGYCLEPAADDVIDAVEFTRGIRRARAACLQLARRAPPTKPASNAVCARLHAVE